MILLRDIQDFIDTFEVVENTYCGRMDDKPKRAVGVYPLKEGRATAATLGGKENCSYEIKGISLLIHWNESPTESERAAIQLQEALSECKHEIVNNREMLFVQISYDEPVPVGQDEGGIFEYVIECLFYFRKG